MHMLTLKKIINFYLSEILEELVGDVSIPSGASIPSNIGASTPLNTLGMGNPVPPGTIDGKFGSEPLVGAKTLKSRKKCKKCNKKNER